MKLLIIVFCVSLSYGDLLSDTIKNYVKIPNGNIAERGQFPFIASLQRKIGSSWYHTCGASLISNDRVVTAAHCIDGVSASNIRVVVGAHTLSGTTPQQQNINIATIVKHQGYDPSTIANDIAIVKLENPAILDGTYVAAISLPPQSTEIPTGDVIVAGWYSNREGGSFSDYLSYVQMPMVTDEECKRSYGSNLILPGMICAGLPQGGTLCQGNSGGPLIQGNVLVGVVSWGYGCGRPNYPDVFTGVAYYRNWIDSN